MRTAIYKHANQDMRSLLRAMGVDEYNATHMIPYMFIAPATTDLDMAQVILTIKALQNALAQMGAKDVRVTGALDLPTAAALTQVAGPGWKSAPWYQIIQMVVWKGAQGTRLRTASGAAPAMGYTAQGAFALPVMPFGIWGWVAAAGAAYYYFGTRKRA